MLIHAWALGFEKTSMSAGFIQSDRMSLFKE